MRQRVFVCFSEACAKGASEVPSAVKLASQVKFAFFAKTQDAPAGRPHPLGAPARLAFGIGALRLALRASRGGFHRLGRALVLGTECKERGKIAYLSVPRARGRILADAPVARLHACLCTLLQALSLLRSEGACWFLGGI